jgi:hypothetical protein
MRIALTARNSAALLALSFLMQETHELAHTSVGRVLCGCWGKRDFNVWGLCRDCASEPPLTLLATGAGPFYSFSVIWLGFYLLSRVSPRAKSVGFALVVSSMPFSRVLTPLFGGGDEIFALTRLGIGHPVAWASTLVLVFALAIPPLVKIHRLIDNRHKLLWLAGLLLAPFLAVGIVVFGVLQGLVLRNGVLADAGILGSPMIVTLWLTVSAGLFAMFAAHIPTLLQPASLADGPHQTQWPA